MMLREIYVKNYILVPELRLKFPEGMTVISGETGAGKSILVGSIGLIFAESASGLEAWDKTRPIYLEAVFGINSDPNLREYLAQINAESDADLILAREISVAGKSSYFIGGRRVTATVIKALKGLLVDFHHQRDQQKLLSGAYQLEVLDRFGDAQGLREDFSRRFREIKKERQTLQVMLSKQEEQKQKLELYRYQYEELQKAEIKCGEDQALQKEYELLTHSVSITELVQNMNQELFEDEHSVLDKLAHYNSHLQEYRDLNDSLGNAAESLLEALESLKSSSEFISGLLNSLSYDPERLARVEARLDLINELLHKHRVKTVDELQQLFLLREQELKDAEDFEQAIELSRRRLEQSLLELQDCASKLSKTRTKAAKELAEELQISIRKLALKDARFQIEIDKIRKSQNLNADPLSAYAESGQDSVNFMFSANPGTTLKALTAVASGGEMSRILLGIKEVLASREAPRLLVLDEIDSGIGGKTAESVAACISEIAKRHPVLCITHLAQIAAQADTHIAVEKNSDKKTTVTLRMLDAEDRTKELARMLSGKLTDASLKHAEELRQD